MTAELNNYSERLDGLRRDEEGMFRASRLSFQIAQISKPSYSLDLQTHPSNLEPTTKVSRRLFFLLAFKSLGVVYGDIGTSPLYTIDTAFNGQEQADVDIIGIVSLLIWTVTLLVTFKYVIFIMMADSSGEGGTFALTSLLCSARAGLGKKRKAVFIFVSMVGASFILGDGALTPSISVLSAVEGLEVVTDKVQPYNVLITIGILIILFLAQAMGTSKIGVLFAPIMCLWFLSLGAIGIYQIVLQPTILLALNPGQAVDFLIRSGYNGFVMLGSIFLAVTGLEALYADMGQFGAGSIRLSWLAFVWPALVLNYLGQGACLLINPTAISNPFFYAIPTPVYWPMFVLSILATIIASQALITGAFSLISQAVNLNFFPTVRVRHTSSQVYGQVYIAEINFLLLVFCIIIVAAFQQSTKIGAAYGLTVCVVMNLTTVVYAFQLRYYRKYPWFVAILFMLIFLTYDAILLASNALKFLDGAWVAVVISLFYFLLMVIWYFGERRLRIIIARMQQHVSLQTLLHEEPNRKLNRLPGMGVFVTPLDDRVPRSFTNLVARICVVPETIVFLKIKFEKAPFVDFSNAFVVKTYGNQVFQVTARLGYMETRVNVALLIHEAMRRELLPQVDQITYFFSYDNLTVKKRKNFIAFIIYSLYAFLKAIFKVRSTRVTTPPDSTVEIGTQATL